MPPFFRHPSSLDHDTGPGHPERADRIRALEAHLEQHDWLGWERPEFAHMPLLRNVDKSKISKRKNPAARLTLFREEGYLPEALVNFLGMLGYSLPWGEDVFTFRVAGGTLAIRRGEEPHWDTRVRTDAAALQALVIHGVPLSELGDRLELTGDGDAFQRLLDALAAA